jgi:nucleotide-binding universal stress UspA family protein
MRDESNAYWMAAAEQRFDRARRQAFLESVIGQLRGQPTSLLPFDDVRDSLGLVPAGDRGVHEIPLTSIVGSVGRYHEFTRSFLPRDDSIRERWKRIYAAAQGMEGLPPVEVYRVGDVYFVNDGNHRVSVAREMGAKTIQAYVREFSSPAPISPDTNLDELIVRSEEARFLKHTDLDELRAQANIQVTSPGYYDKLEEHIAVHGYFLGLEEQRRITWQEAVIHWYDYVYLPLIETIRMHNILQEFPGRTETDLYLWIIEHRHFLAQRLGLDIDMHDAARDFAARYSPRWRRVVERAQRSIADAITPQSLESGAPVAHWRRQRAESHAADQLFAELLLLVDDSETSWCAIEQALVIAEYERSSLYCLWMGPYQDKKVQRSAFGRALSRRCDLAGVPCRLIAESDEPMSMVLERAPWVDLVVLGQAPPETSPVAPSWDAVLHTALRHIAPPVLAMAGPCRPLTSALLAYDDSPTSAEALFIAAHIGQNWEIPVHIITVDEPRRTSKDTLDKAIAHMQERHVKTEGFFRAGAVEKTILTMAAELDVELLILGASGYSPFTELFVRSTLDRVVHQATCPVLICR